MISFFPSRAVALSVFGFDVHWYGLLYLLGFVGGAVLLPRLQRYRGMHLPRDTWLSFLSWLVIGVIVGGRLGYVFFYEPSYFLRHPLDIFAVWNGGMAFHGGLIGVLIALVAFCRKNTLSILAVGDILVIPVAIGLALGRLGNFINQELYGTVTTLPWGMHFDGVEGLRHPIQFYEMTTDLLTALVCFLYLRSSSVKHSGKAGALFLILYGIARFLIEYVRDQQQYALLNAGGVMLTRGQLLTAPLFVAGVVLWFACSKKKAHL